MHPKLQEIADELDDTLRAICTPVRWCLKPWDQIQQRYNLYGLNWLRLIRDTILFILLGPFLLLKKFDELLKENGMSLKGVAVGCGAVLLAIGMCAVNLLTAESSSSQ